MTDMPCHTCGAENRSGRRFCNQCGAPLHLSCASCGAANEPGDRFCGDCGAPLTTEPHLLALRGDTAAMQALLDEPLGPSGWAETDLSRPIERAILLRAAGRVDYSVPEIRDAVISMMEAGISHVPLAFSDAVDCAFAAGQPAAVQELIDRVDALAPSQLLPLLEAEAARARARLGVSRGDQETAERWYKRAIHLFRELATPCYLARAQCEYAELLGEDEDDRAAAALRDDAATVFESLDARPWLERARALVAEVAA